MSGFTNFDRQYRLSVGKAGSNGFEIGKKKTLHSSPLHINFSLQKSDLTTPNTGKIAIWNLNSEHLTVLNQKNCVVALKAGYGNNLPLIFAGVVSFVTTQIDGCDRKTEIEVVDSLVATKNVFVSVSYKGTVNWKEIFDDTAKQMGVAISYSYNAVFSDIHNGFSYVGKAKSILDKGCDCCGLTWSIQNGVLQVKKPGDVMSKEVYKLSSDTGLVRIPSRVIVSEDEETGESVMGWDVEFLLNGAINVDDYVYVDSLTVKGYFRVYSLEIQGDNLSGDWMCKARLLEVKR